MFFCIPEKHAQGSPCRGKIFFFQHALKFTSNPEQIFFRLLVSCVPYLCAFGQVRVVSHEEVSIVDKEKYIDMMDFMIRTIAGMI